MSPATKLRHLVRLLRRAGGASLLAAHAFEKDELGPSEIDAATLTVRLTAEIVASIANEVERVAEELEPSRRVVEVRHDS